MLAQLLVWKVQLPGGLLLMRDESISCRYTMHALHNIASDLVLSAHVTHSCAVSFFMSLPETHYECIQSCVGCRDTMLLRRCDSSLASADCRERSLRSQSHPKQASQPWSKSHTAMGVRLRLAWSCQATENLM